MKSLEQRCAIELRDIRKALLAVQQAATREREWRKIHATDPDFAQAQRQAEDAANAVELAERALSDARLRLHDARRRERDSIIASRQANRDILAGKARRKLAEARQAEMMLAEHDASTERLLDWNFEIGALDNLASVSTDTTTLQCLSQPKSIGEEDAGVSAPSLAMQSAARILGMTRQGLSKVIRRGDLPCTVTAAGHRLIRLHDLRLFDIRRRSRTRGAE